MREHGAVVHSTELWRFPTERVLDIRGLGVDSALLDDASRLIEVSALVIEANPVLFELPEWAGELLPQGVEERDDGRVVRWIQAWRTESGVLVPVQDAGVSMRFESDGRLSEIENRARLALW